MSQEKEDHIEVSIKLPKKLMDFLKDMEQNMDMTVEQYLEYCIIEAVGADLDTMKFFLQKPKQLIKNYGLKDILKHTCISYCCG